MTIAARESSARKAERLRYERFETFEFSLSIGLTVPQALDDAGWSNAAAAVRVYQRWGREVPVELHSFVHRERQQREVRS